MARVSSSTPIPARSLLYNKGKSSTISKQQEATNGSMDHPMPFSRLVLDCALPFQVDISESLYGVVGGGSLFQGEQFCLHFLKETDALIAKCGCETYYIPVCSSYQCNISACKDEPRALADFRSMVRFLSPLPKVVCVHDAHDNGAGSVRAGELLLVKEVSWSPETNKVKFITCWSITEQKEKYLNKLCKASFNVAPEATKVYLRDVIDHCQLPMTVQLYTTGTSTITLTINERSLVKSVIASKQTNPDELLEILASTDMMAKKLETSASSSKELQKHTALVYKAFHPSKITMVIASGSAIHVPYKKSVYTNVLGDWRNNIQLVPPQSLLPKKKKSPKPCEAIVPPLSSRSTTLQQVNKTETYSCLVDTTCRNDASVINSVVYNVAHPFPMTASDCMKTLGHDVSTECANVPKNPPLTHRESFSTKNKVKSQQYEENYNIISKFTPDQVLDLLDALNLSQYKEVFEREQITGGLFLELDREILHDDLEVTSQLHQTRIMQIIEGVKPVPL